MQAGPPDPRARRKSAIGALILAVIYVTWAVPFMLESSVVAIDGRRYFGLFDDAMISMRYAWNFSHGQGLVWNPGERIEGYTNLLWTLVMSGFTSVMDKVSAVLAVQIVGIIIVLGCAAMTWKLAQRVAADRQENERARISAAAALLVLTYYPLSHFTLTGMETGLLALLIAAALWSLEGYAANGRGINLIWMATLLGLAYLTREDSALLALPILAYAITLPEQRGGWRQRMQLWLPALGVFVSFVVGREAFRWFYYGALLPNTYYLKMTGMAAVDRVRNGLGFTSLYFVTHALVLVVAIAGYALKPERRRLLYLALVVLPILYQIWVGGDPVRMWRMMIPALPATAVLFALGSMGLAERASRGEAPRPRTRIFSYLTALAVVSVNLIYLPFIAQREKWFPLDFYRPRINAAVALNEIASEDASVAVLAAGVVPYYTDLRAHDMLGRTDAYIASLPPDMSGAVGWGGMSSVPGHNKYDLDYSVKQLRPTYVEAGAWGGQDITAWMNEHYVRVTYKGVEMWLLRDSPDVRWELLDR